MIVSIRGTSGSGKSTVVRMFLEKYNHKTLESNDPKPKILGYKVEVPDLIRPVMIVGSYKNDCGGCDGIQPYSLIWPRIVEYATQGHVLFEGLMISSSYGNIGRASEVYGDEVVFAFMSTPLEVCIERIQQRRMRKGNTKPLDPKNTIGKYRNVQRSISVIRSLGRRVVMLEYKKPFGPLMNILREGDNAPR